MALRVIVIPRQPAPVHVLHFGPAEASSTARGPHAKPTEARGPTVVIPAVGEVTLVELEDGSRVWVARHQNGEITVLAGDLPVPNAAVGGLRDIKPLAPGMFVPSLWQPAARCYNSLFDADARRLKGTAGNLKRSSICALAILPTLSKSSRIE